MKSGKEQIDANMKQRTNIGQNGGLTRRTGGGKESRPKESDDNDGRNVCQNGIGGKFRRGGATCGPQR
jgi:hypothetical protein